METTSLSEHENEALEHNLSIEELQNALKDFHNNKTPGEDGFTKEFCDTCFDLLGNFLLDSFNAAFHHGKLSVTQNRGIISLIPKEESNLTVLSNWRPIILLNVDYKILAKASAKRIQSKLPKLIHTDQIGFIKERFIEQNVRLLNDSMGYTDAKKILLDSFNAAFHHGKLSVTQKRGIISLIPKEESNLTVLSNWRPIILLNVDYKILAKASAKRIQSKLPKLIHTDQIGFIKERFIEQNVRLLNDSMGYTDAKKIPGILLFIDFEKAFDTIEWSFLQNVLKNFNFGPVIRHWVSTLYGDVESAVIDGGYMSNFFKISRGVRQGCPLIPLLFVLVAEILAQKIR